ncbi:MAG: alkaline phosphatase family protein [Tannerella sp.]|jgi:predicted AlkP superfamily pyrophosphatase or phosphodiesterase|nr:alkaline phosphatase family protein [Tannerella sp.]
MKAKVMILNAALLLPSVSCSTREERSETGCAADGIKHVYVIGIDGLSSEGLNRAETPSMDGLMRDGVLCDPVRTVLPSSSSPNWASMLMGAGPEIHGVTSNEWQPGDDGLPPAVTNDYGYFPTALSVICAQRPGIKAGMFYHWEDFGRLFEKTLPHADRHFPDEYGTAAAMAEYIRAEKPEFIFSQFDHVDGAGHRYGHMTREYLDAVARADSLVGMILDAVREAGIRDETLIIVVSDHGGVGKGHGGTDLKEVTVPFILGGAGVKKGFHVQTEVYMYDVAPTIVYALGLKAPHAWRGRAIESAFEGVETPQDPLPLNRIKSF